MRRKKTGKKIWEAYRSLGDEQILESIRQTKETGGVFNLDLSCWGFQGVEEETIEDEIKAEERSVPENINQEFIVGFFEGKIKLSSAVLDAYDAEKNENSPNFPLLRKYFRKGTPALKTLLCFGLDHDPTDPSLLHDLAFLHENCGMLSELINRYATACRLENDPESFAELAIDFHYNTLEDGFDALQELLILFGGVPEKRSIIECLLMEHRTVIDSADNIIVV